MSSPTEAAYAAAALAYDEAVNEALGNPPGSVFGAAGRQLWIDHPAFRAAVDAVWPLAVAEGRRLAAEAIRAWAATRPDCHGACLHEGCDCFAMDIAEDAARIAAGEQT